MEARSDRATWVRRALPLVLLAGLAAIVLLSDLQRYLTFDQLAAHRRELLAWGAVHPWQAPLLFILAYIAVVALSLPGATVMTVSGGFLFGALSGTLYAVVGATIGATIIFLIAKSSLGDWLLARVGPGIRRMQQGFERNALNYLFVLRLIPIFPFFLVNLAPAFLGVPLPVYLLATFFGIMPATYVYSLAGAGLGAVFDRGEAFSPQAILTPEMIGALAGLAMLALLPLGYRRWKERRRGGIDV